MKVSTGSLNTSGGGPVPRAAPCRAIDQDDLADELVLPVRLDLEDVELRVQRIVRLRGELEAPAEDPVLDLHLLDVLEDRLTGRAAVALLARHRDGGQGDLRRAV